MGKIFSNQPFKIELGYDELPGAVASVQIKYQTPQGQKGSWNASIDRVGKKIFYYSAEGETLRFVGPWLFWSVILLDNGERYPGEPVSWVIYREGK